MSSTTALEGAHDAAAERISARLDSLPSSRPIWALVAVLSLGSFCEIYDLGLTAYLSPALVKAGVFARAGSGLLGLDDAATFIALTFLGFWIGTLFLSRVSDRWGRVPALRYPLVFYSLTSCLMGLQSTALGIDLLRFLTGIGMGVQVIAIDCFIAEVVPKAIRGRAFAISTAIQFCGAPFAAVLALLLVPKAPLGIEGWRWLTFMPGLLAVLVLVLQRKLPESPRWLAQNGRLPEAQRVVDHLEARVLSRGDRPSLQVFAAETASLQQREPELPKAEHRKRLFMMGAANFLQAIGYFGFVNWVPSLLEAKGADLKHSIGYSASIALSFPVAPLAISLVADRFERKHLLIAGLLTAAVFGVAFANQSTPAMWILFGVLVTISNNVLAFALHNYQSEIFPTRNRSRSVGLVYSFTRLSTIFSGYLVAFLLTHGGVGAVFTLLDGSLLAAAVLVGTLGPRTRGKAVEEIA